MTDSAVTDRLHIAFLSNGLFPYQVGGMQKHTVNLVKHLPSSGCDVDLYYVADDRYPMAEEVQSELFDQTPGIRVCPVRHRKLPYFPGHHYPDCYWTSRSYRRAIREATTDYDFVYAQGYMGWASVASRRKDLDRGTTDSGVPVGVNFHGIEALQDPQDLLTTIRNAFAPVWLKWNLRHADCVLSLGGALDTLTEEQGVRPDRILSSCNGIAPGWFDQERPAGDGVRRLLFVGRDSARKGFTELNAVLPGILNDSDCEVHFAGNVSEANRLQHERVIYHGMVKSEADLQTIYRRCDVLLCPSHSEGMPTVILEAAACGLPAIATDVGAVRLMVSDETGWLIPARDIQALDVAIRDALQTDLWAKAAAAERVARTFTWDQVAARTADGIAAFVGRRQKVRA